MRLWLQVRRAPLCALTIAVVALALVPARSLYLPLPNVLGGPRLAVPLTFLLPVAVAIMVAWGLTSGDPLLEAVASRPLRRFDTTYALLVAALACAAYAFVGVTSSTELALAAGRNALGYVGLMLIGRRLVGGQAAGIVPAAFALAVSLFGTGVSRQTRVWAWPLGAAHDPIAWLSAALLLLLGVLIELDSRPAAAER